MPQKLHLTTLRFRHGKADTGILRVYFPDDSSNEAKFTNYKSLMANSNSTTVDILQQSLQKYRIAFLAFMSKCSLEARYSFL